ncbi:MAG: hypothetical protein AAF191_08285, partial [Verrucomicrobiota bacterium]
MKGSWFQVRGTLSPLRGVLLTIASFLFPLIVWSFFAYTPGLWDVSHRLLVTTDLKNDSFSTIYRSDHIMEAERFQEFQQMVRDRNEQIRTYLKEGGELPQEIVISSRANQKVIRKLHPVGVEMGWLTDDQGTDNAALYQLWGELAEGKKKVPEILSAENQDLLRENWAVLGALGASYDSASFPSEPLLHLIPDGKRSI